VESLSPLQVEQMAGEAFAVYSLKNGYRCVIGREELVPATLRFREADLVVFSPVKNGFAPIGLVDKMNPPAALLSVENCAGALAIETRGGGRFGFYSGHPVQEIRLNDTPVPFLVQGNFFTMDTGDHAICRITVCTTL